LANEAVESESVILDGYRPALRTAEREQFCQASEEFAHRVRDVDWTQLRLSEDRRRVRGQLSDNMAALIELDKIASYERFRIIAVDQFSEVGGKLFWDGKFDEMEVIAAETAHQKARFLSGHWKMPYFATNLGCHKKPDESDWDRVSE